MTEITELPFEEIENSCQHWGISLPHDARSLFQQYTNLLLDWNQRINLTAITDPYEIAVKHFIDSLSLLAVYQPAQGASLLDIGSGAGFPSIPLLIVRRDLQITMLDSLNKRLVFLQTVLQNLELHAQTIHIRAEEGAKKPVLREQFDVVTARAVAALPVLLEYCIPYVNLHGVFIAFKGPDGVQETKIAQNAAKTLGCELSSCNSLILPDNSKRTMLIYKKMVSTPTKFPRIGAKITKSPL